MKYVYIYIWLRFRVDVGGNDKCPKSTGDQPTENKQWFMTSLISPKNNEHNEPLYVCLHVKYTLNDSKQVYSARILGPPKDV